MDKLKVSMTEEDVNKAFRETFKWSRDTIEAQKAEIERQRGLLDRIYAAHGCSVTIEPWCSTCGKNVHTIECQKCSEFWVANDLEKLNMQAEIERLRALVKEAYEEGWSIADWIDQDLTSSWMESDARDALQPKEGD